MTAIDSGIGYELSETYPVTGERLFQALTDAAILKEIWGVQQIEVDARVGGRWGYEFRADGDPTFGFFGVFHSVEPNALLVQTFEFNMAPGLVGVTSTRFEDLGGRTRLSAREIYPSVEARDAAVASGMEYGMKESYERLDELLAANQ